MVHCKRPLCLSNFLAVGFISFEGVRRPSFVSEQSQGRFLNCRRKAPAVPWEWALGGCGLSLASPPPGFPLPGQTGWVRFLVSVFPLWSQLGPLIPACSQAFYLMMLLCRVWASSQIVRSLWDHYTAFNCTSSVFQTKECRVSVPGYV